MKKEPIYNILAQNSASLASVTTNIMYLPRLHKRTLKCKNAHTKLNLFFHPRDRTNKPITTAPTNVTK
jgi:hypothetical protein